jgi:hypothetical protein
MAAINHTVVHHSSNKISILRMFLNDQLGTLGYRSLHFGIIPNEIKPNYRLSINEEEESIKCSLQSPTEYYPISNANIVKKYMNHLKIS